MPPKEPPPEGAAQRSTELRGSVWGAQRPCACTAVGLFHFSGGNLGGAVKLYRSNRDYMARCGSPFQGLDVTDFWRQMERCFAPLLNASELDRSLRPNAETMPIITLEPPPAAWPDPPEHLHEEE